MNTHPHANQPVLSVGPDPAAARVSAILIHGRGASARDILGVAHELSLPDVAFVAPQAAGNTWYPYSFLAPIAQNEPSLTSALSVIEDLVQRFEQAGVASDRVALLGFSQGACLTLEFAARHPRRYHTIVAFSGGAIGPPGTPRDYPGSFEATPAFLGCSDVDAHIPVERVHESADVYRRMGATVDARIYPGMGHTINEDEIAAARALLSR